MMGERVAMQDRLFYAFRLEEHVPAGHLLRIVDRFVDLSDLERFPLGLNRDSQGGRKGGVLASDSAL